MYYLMYYLIKQDVSDYYFKKVSPNEKSKAMDIEWSDEVKSAYWFSTIADAEKAIEVCELRNYSILALQYDLRLVI